MKKVLYIFLSFVMAQSFVACETVDFGDTNDNPNGPQEVYPAGLLAGAMEAFSTMTGREGVMNPTLYVQYQSQVTYTDEMLYAESPASWAIYYNQVLPNLNAVIQFNEDEANHTPALLNQGEPVNQIGVAKIYRAIVLKRLTDTWGDVPFSEAFLGLENLTPVYDSQEEIYMQIFADLTEGRDMLDASKAGPIGDLIYEGNVNNWKKLANSVLLQASMQLSLVDDESTIDAAGIFNEALAHPAGVIDEVSEEAWYRYESITSFQNPFNRNRRADYFMSGELVDALQGDPMATSLNPTSSKTYDPRLEVYARYQDREGVPYGFNDASGSNRNQLSAFFWAAEAPLPLMTASYTFLNRAEAAERNWTTEDAAEMLRKGIAMSFETLEFHTEEEFSNDGSAYIAARLADAATVGMLQVIAEEKWKTLFPNGFDAWAEWRRTELPALEPAEDALNDGEIARRYLYPTEEFTLNKENLQGGITGLAPASDINTAKVWWDQN